MPRSISPDQNINTISLGKRRFLSIELEPCASLAQALGWTQAELFKSVLLAIILEGSIKTRDRELKSGDLASLTEIDDVCTGIKGCVLGLVAWEVQHQPTRQFLHQRPTMQWYDKYQAWLSELTLLDNGHDLLSPWTGYAIRLPFSGESVDLHVHKTLKNLIFVKGSSKATAGYLIVETQQNCTAYPLIGGDIVLVQPGIKHNLVAKDKEADLEFFVFNDTPSNYQEAETSDYHMMQEVPWHKIIISPRSREKPIILHVGD
jgi:hypothetical protein